MKFNFTDQGSRPWFGLERRDSVTRLLTIILVSTAVINSLYIGVRMLFGDRSWDGTIIVNVVLLLFQLGLLIIVRAGYIRAASLALIFSSWVCMTYLAWVTDGVRDSAVMVYILIITISSLIASWRISLLVAGMSILAVWGLAVGETLGLRVRSFESPISTAWELTVIFLLLIVLVYLIVSTVKQAVDTVREGEERFRRVFHVSPVAISVTALKDGRLLDANAAYWNLTGFDAGSSLGRTTVELKLWENETERLAFTQKLIEQKSLHNPTYEFVNGKGQKRFTAVFHELIDHGREPTVLSMFYDVTEQILAQKSLQASEEKYRTFVESSAEGIWFLAFDKPIPVDLPAEEQVLLIQRTGFIQDCNLALARMYGYTSRSQLMGKRLLELYGGEVNEVNFQSTLQLVRDNYFGTDRETVEKTADGRTVHFLNTAIGVVEEGNLVGLWGTQVDITPLKLAQDALRREEVRTRAVLEAIPDMIFEFNRDGVILNFISSPTMDTLLPPEEFLGRKISEVMPPDVVDQTMFSIQRTLESGQLHIFEYPLAVGGEKKHYEARMVAGDSNTVIVMVRDITLRKWAEAEREKLIEELEAKNAELERFTYTVSHDLKSPLITIRGFLGFIREDLQTGNRTRLEKDMQRVRDATDKMQKLLADLLELSRVGRMINEPDFVDMNELVADAMELVHGRLAQSNPRVLVHEDLPKVYGDRQRLLEVLQNLIDNAAKFIGEVPDPTIEIGQDGELDGMPVFFVRDNGIGIDPRYTDSVFGLFNKLDPLSDGTGVGLALVKRIIEFHGGRIWLQSEPGTGATFFFTLPVAEAKPG
ncbi:MAG: hypothetical protein C3F07_12445 [Anaerolineales bacterium]|nr:PAS domain S-box protein [Anaerolineae bacterium]PWB72119.1 MAG: hypothetical protein C3F07_12445 [Anaerolineales bacterium]